MLTTTSVGGMKMPSEDVTDGIVQCVRCGCDLTDPKNSGDPDKNGDWVCADAVCRASHDVPMTVERVVETSDPDEETPQEVWERHNESFQYDPPQKRPEAWSSDEVQKLVDRTITRRTEWFCDLCTGRGPMGSLRKARNHVESHTQKLLDRYAPDEDELEAATDGGTSEDDLGRGADSHGLSEFGGGDRTDE